MKRTKRSDLTVCDWEEISAAIWTKRIALRQGRYGPDETKGDTKRWIKHLSEILEKIGPDGHRACRRYGASEDCGHDHPDSLGATQALRRLIKDHANKRAKAVN